ncbi:SusC/RagA family TonB-linked outer membrane protein [Chitinophaga lutea]|uniref:SusC/RagA family TonB-linked outer membrane protein n=1 Tax=Chitinophaga lutea TaxID=2488634 RepID=A0A3N4PB71_9BACT|nr:SusC/RagA family TonB-linked outer membrane protein [Chitinophaga lutea]RPE05365.1 SusC/RagA family TonB-linked outer membrane protein [Chitinophaga lutea]
MKTITHVAFRNLLLLLCSVLFFMESTAQSPNPVQLSGTVTSAADGQPVIGATITLANAKNVGAVTDPQGHFTLRVPASHGPVQLIVTFIGYERKTINVPAGQTQVDIALGENTKALNEVVVTALGIKKQRKAVTYAMTEVKGSEFTQAREINVADALTGKIAGVNASSLAGGPGSSSRVVIRGNGSFGSDNQPLYVINGMPIDNSTPNVPASGNASIGLNADRGDGIAGINPDDIESITVLKGATASALYGSRAANGVIMITTKKGVKQKGIGVDFNSTLTVETPSIIPDWQYEYGQGQKGLKPVTQADAIASGRLSFGPRIDGANSMQFDGVSRPYTAQKNNIKNFYRTGTTFTNTIAASGGGDFGTYRLSLSDMNNYGLVPHQQLNKKIFSLSLTGNLHKRVTVEGYAQYNIEKAVNRANVSDAPGNPNWGTYMLANTVDVRNLAPGYNTLTGAETLWNPSGFASNPYFVVNRFVNNDDRRRFIGNVSVKFNILDNLFLRGRVNHDFTDVGWTGIVPTGTAYAPKGFFQQQTNGITETNGELTLNYSGRLGKNFTLDAMAGGNQRKAKTNNVILLGTDFSVPNFYDPSNVVSLTTTNQNIRSAVNSVFGSVDLGYKDMLFLTATGRNDWFSTLDPRDNNIFYPSIGASFLLSEAVKLPGWINYAKVRASWAQVGGGTPAAYVLTQTYSLVPGGGHLGQPLQTPTQTVGTTSGLLNAPNASLKPYTSTTYEAGLEARFLGGRLSADLAVYNRRTTDDIVQVSISPASGYNTTFLNVGEMNNKGIELMLSGTAVKQPDFSWDVTFTGSYNKNEVLKLADGLDRIQMDVAVNSYAFIFAEVGKPYSTIKGYKVKKNAEGKTMYNKANGFELTTGLEDLGTGVSPWSGGINNSFSYKRFNLSFLIDGKFGGHVYSGTNLYATRFGLHRITLPGREGGLTVTGVDDENKPFTRTFTYNNDLQAYYDNYKFQSERFIYSSDFIKLRQVILGYSLPANLFSFAKFQSVSLSLVGRNLLILHKKAPNIDPESTFNNSNAQGFEMFGVPRTRSFGLNLMVKL